MVTTVNTQISTKDSPVAIIGESVPDIPKINKILNIQEPTAFPRASPLSPFRVATMDVTSSGKEVPTATMVSPIRFWLNPKFLAISLALSTTKFPPNTTAASPPSI